MGIRHGSVHDEHGRIKWAQAHGMRNVIECEVRLTSPDPQPGTKRPTLRKVRIDRQSPIHESRSVVELMGYKGECISTHTQRCWVIVSEMHCSPGQPRSFGTLLRMLDRPATKPCVACSTKQPCHRRRPGQGRARSPCKRAGAPGRSRPWSTYER